MTNRWSLYYDTLYGVDDVCYFSAIMNESEGRIF